MKLCAALFLLALPCSPQTQSPGNVRSQWFVDSKVDQITLRTEYTIFTTAASETKADLQLVCFDSAVKGIHIVVDQPVSSSGYDGISITAVFRLDDGAPFVQRVGVLPDTKTILVTGDEEERRLIRSHYIAMRYQAAGGVPMTVVFTPQSLDHDAVTKYCGSNPQEPSPVQLVIEHARGKVDYRTLDEVDYWVDNGLVISTHVTSLPQTAEANFRIKVAVRNKTTMDQLGFRLNGQPVVPEWHAIKDPLFKFTVTFQKP